MGIEVANASCVLGHGTGSLVKDGAFVVVSIPSLKVKAGGGGVHKKEIEFTFAGGSDVAGVMTPGSVVTGDVVSGAIVPSSRKIPATAIKGKTNGDPLMRKGDLATVGMAGLVPGTPPVATPIQGIVEITDAGQVKVKCL